MAIDEVLLQTARRPLLRFYRWSEPAVSFGYFGRSNEAEAFAAGRVLVRRWTGGGIVPHGDDLTYSIVFPSSAAARGLLSSEIYWRVHDSIARALRGLGIRAELAQLNAPKITDSCFANPVIADLMEAGRKIAGAAHRKTRAGLLHQGSIQRPDFDQQFFRGNLAKILGELVMPDAISSSVLKAAEELSAAKYATAPWLRRR
jgi:lipoyl(octanoyl) transferase